MPSFDETHSTWTHDEYTHGDHAEYLAYLAQVEAYEAFQKKKATSEDESEAA